MNAVARSLAALIHLQFRWSHEGSELGARSAPAAPDPRWLFRPEAASRSRPPIRSWSTCG